VYVKKTEGGEVREWRASYDEDEQLETRTLCKERRSERACSPAGQIAKLRGWEEGRAKGFPLVNLEVYHLTKRSPEGHLSTSHTNLSNWRSLPCSSLAKRACSLLVIALQRCRGKPGEGSVSGATSPRNSLLADRRCCLLQQSS
jgi:hypothetical protein